METAKTTSVQIMSPMPGLTRKLPPPESPSVAARTAVFRDASIAGLEEEREKARDEPVEEARLGEGEAQPLDRRDLVAHLGLAGHGLDDLAEDRADADAGADGAEAATHAEGDGAARVGGGVLAGGLGEGG